MRNLLATLLTSPGVPMLTAGDERGRTQRGNNNAYCTDSELTWVDWSTEPWQEALTDTVRTLTRLRREHPALRPTRFGVEGACTLSANDLSWHDASGDEMSAAGWEDPAARTLQLVAASTPETEEQDTVLLLVHGAESSATVRLPAREGVSRWLPLWSSDDAAVLTSLAPGDAVLVTGPTVVLWQAS